MAARSSSRIALGVAGAALALLGGCVVAPVEPYPGAPVAYTVGPDGTPYYYAPGYYGNPYYSYPYYWGPTVSLGFYGGWGGYHGRWSAPPSRPGWGRPGGGSRPGYAGRPGGGGSRPGFSGGSGGRR